jgi:tetratricopeptide (TPR) repeat protein
MRLIRPRIRAKTDDPALRAAYALGMLALHKAEEAHAVVDKDLTDQYPPALVVASFASAALGKRREAAAFAQDALSLLPNAPEAHYAQAISAIDLRVAEQEMLQTLATSAFHPGPFLNYASRVAASRRTDRYEVALNLTDFVLKSFPKNFHAKQIQTLIYMQTRKLGDAEPILRSLLATPDAKEPDFLMTLAIYYETKGDGAQSARMLEQVRKIDEKHFDTVSAPSPIKHIDFVNRIWLFRAGFFLNPKTLFPNKS